MQIFIVEAAHTFGVCLFVFNVLPRFDVIRALLLMNACCVMPAILKLIMTKGKRGPMSVVIDILAVLMQCSVFFLITRFFTRGRTMMDDAIDIVQVAASLVLISLRYWENYIDRDIGSISIQSFKNSLRLGRCKTYIFASLWKMGLTLAFAYILVPNMTPMKVLFDNVRNETLYFNSSDSSDYFDLGQPAYDSVNDSSLDSATSFYPGVTVNRIAPRFRRQVNTSIIIERPLFDDVPSYDSTATTQLPKDNDRLDDDGRGTLSENNIDDNQNEIQDQNENNNNRNNRQRPRRPRPSNPSLFPRQPTGGDFGDTYDYDYSYETEEEEGYVIDKLLYRFLPLIVQSISGAVCYYFARVACKLCMQGFGFSFPLTLITPATVGIFCYVCHLEGWTGVRLPNLSVGFWRCSEGWTEVTFQWQIGCAICLWWLSQLWIVQHVWFSQSERLAKVERWVQLIIISPV